MKVYMMTGICGTGKTWAIKKLIEKFNLSVPKQAGTYQWVENPEGTIAALGKYDGAEFEGSDRLSMAIMKDNATALQALGRIETVFCEGDRFMNQTFIAAFNPIIIRIMGSGEEGRKKRGSEQTARHLKAITTRVNNTPYAYRVEDSKEAYELISNDVSDPKMIAKNYVPQSLFD